MLFKIIHSRKLLNKLMMNFIAIVLIITKLRVRCMFIITLILTYCEYVTYCFIYAVINP